MEKRTLGKLSVSALGLGCMGMSEFYGHADEARSMQTIEKAYEMGINFFDTADMYGFGHNEDLVGKAIKKFRDNIILATKFGIVRKKEDPEFREISGKPDYVKKCCEASLKRLGVDVIDLYYQHRVDPNTPIEETVQAMADLLKEGKIRAIGLSEASPEILRRAHAVHPITALQSEYSLWTRDPEKEILDVCDELGIGFVAYSPIGRGFFSGKITSPLEFEKEDFRGSLPRFQAENFQHNIKIVEILKDMARHIGCTPTQLAIAWVLARSPHIVPIFGTTKPEHLAENLESLKVHLSPDDLVLIDELVPLGFAKGERYGVRAMKAYQFKK